jgi:hypothetical protein
VFPLANIRAAQDADSLGVGSHQTVLDAIVDHLDEVAGAVGAAVQVALLGGAFALLASGGARNVARAGASVLKIGSRCVTASTSPPIIMQ